jgi:predicted transcriptional regulator
MDRTTLTLDAALRKRLRKIAAERGISMAAFIREAIDDAIERHAPRPQSLGIGASNTHDTARLAGETRPEPRPWR